MVPVSRMASSRNSGGAAALANWSCRSSSRKATDACWGNMELKTCVMSLAHCCAQGSLVPSWNLGLGSPKSPSPLEQLRLPQTPTCMERVFLDPRAVCHLRWSCSIRESMLKCEKSAGTAHRTSSRLRRSTEVESAPTLRPGGISSRKKSGRRTLIRATSSRSSFRWFPEIS